MKGFEPDPNASTVPPKQGGGRQQRGGSSSKQQPSGVCSWREPFEQQPSPLIGMESQPNNPLHGVKLEQILVALEAHYGWEAMGEKINIRCFTDGPTLKSSLKISQTYPLGAYQGGEPLLEVVEDDSRVVVF